MVAARQAQLRDTGWAGGSSMTALPMSERRWRSTRRAVTRNWRWASGCVRCGVCLCGCWPKRGVYDSSSGPVRLRPVVTVVTELPWQNLAGGFRAEAYGQAGYAGGLGPTAFFDAQAVVDHSIAKATRLRRDVRIGAGIWAGGQKGAVRFDAGPRVSMPLDMGDGTSARIALDWRLRVAGNANPASGPALTIASSF
jgi:hypothetical protein